MATFFICKSELWSCVCQKLCLTIGNCYFTRCYFMCVYIYIHIYFIYAADKPVVPEYLVLDIT